jgi:hypothetical protein
VTVKTSLTISDGTAGVRSPAGAGVKPASYPVGTSGAKMAEMQN